MIVRKSHQLPASLPLNNDRNRLARKIHKDATRDEAGEPIFYHLPGTSRYENLAKGSSVPEKKESAFSPNQNLATDTNNDGSSTDGTLPTDNAPKLKELPTNTSSLLPILISLVGSTALAALTHFKEDILGPLTKPIKYISVFGALFSATVGAAIGLTPNNSDTSTTEADYSHAVF